jgi:hypothetical protein
MNRLLLGFAFVAALAVSVHARTVHPARVTPASWAVAGTPDMRTAAVHSMVGSSFHVTGI